MLNLSVLETYKERVREIVLAHHATNARVFGSVLHGKAKKTSDLDLLIDPTEEMSLMDIGAIRHELKGLLGVDVDVLTPRALPESFREKVLKEAAPI